MGTVNRIDVHVVTGEQGTDDYVFLGICGVEFRLDSMADDYEVHSGRTYTLGDGSNVKDAQWNTPKEPQLLTEDLWTMPVYIRFHPKSTDEIWRPNVLKVTVNPGLASAFVFERDLRGRHHYGRSLGLRAGTIIYLKKTSGPAEDPS